MSGRVNTSGGVKGRSGWPIRIIGGVAFVSALLYWEQTALIYVLSSLAVCGLLLVVAFSDLEGRDKELSVSTQNNMETTADDSEMTPARSHSRARRAIERKRRDVA